jgi:hypothetical protein
MHNLIYNRGRTVIFSRNLTWVEGKVKQTLIKKAENKELEIYVEKPVEVSTLLEKKGAQIYTYEDLICDAEIVRFTIVDAYKSSGAKLAIGTASKDGSNYHIIEEFSDRDQPVFSMAYSLIAVIKKYNKDKKS